MNDSTKDWHRDAEAAVREELAKVKHENAQLRQRIESAQYLVQQLRATLDLYGGSHE